MAAAVLWGKLIEGGKETNLLLPLLKYQKFQ
jgi:hypothetical protein